MAALLLLQQQAEEELASCKLTLTPTTIYMQHWLVKSEPESYAWANLVKDERTSWDGVRNFQARNNLQQMQPGDLVLFYHSVSE